jgi:TonB-dependent starch-binding outer membrane protein SusC
MKKQITILIIIFLSATLPSFAQTNVKGTVRDSKNLPVPGATVKVKENGKGVATDINGNYTISATAGNTLVISSIGFTTVEEKVGNRTVINIVLQDDSRNLSEVVVIGYGTRAVKDVTGAISSVKAEKLENENPTSVTDLIRGNVPGITVTMNTSAKGGGTGDMQIRGKASLSANTAPLIVLDGVIFQGQLQDINPNDIERVDILRDPSALAVYGSASASGVVAITTKKGKNGPPQITLNINAGVSQLEKNQKYYDPEGFLNWRADGARSSNTTNPYYFYSNPNALPDGVTLAQFMGTSTGDPTTVWLQRLGLQANEIKNYFAGNTTDWSKLVFRNGFRQDYTASVSGRTDVTSYYLSGNFTDNQNLIQGGEYKNYRVRANFEGKASKFLTFGITAQFANRDEGGNEADWTQIINSSPYGDFYNPDGSLRRIDTDDSGLNQRNPFLATVYNQTEAVQNTLFANLYAKVKLPFGIQYTLNFSPDIESYRNSNFIPVANPNELKGGEVSRTMENRYKYQIDNILSWNKTFGIHNIDVTALLNKEKYQTWYTSTANSGLTPSDVLGAHSVGAGSLPVESSDDRIYNADALMGRINYTLLGRYIVTGTIRRDGFSVFGLNNPRSTYPSAALAWILSDESFMKGDRFKWLNFAKLRVSYGANGNRLTTGTADPSLALAILTTGKYATVSSAGVVTNNSTVFSSSLQNADLKWERTTGTNIGLDFTVLNNRLSGSIDVYNRSTTDQIVKRTLLAVQGFNDSQIPITGTTFAGNNSSVLTNVGEVNNRGIEISLNGKILKSKNFNWDASGTFFVNRNKIVHLYGAHPVSDASGNTTMVENDDIGNGWFIGHDIAAVWDYNIQGVWKTTEATEAATYSAKPGDFKMEDVNGDHIYTNADKQFLGSKTGQFNWSLRNDFNFYKNFDFSFLLVSSIGQLTQFNSALNNPGSVGFARMSSYVLPYWTADNQIDNYARLNSGSEGTTINVWRKSSFVRVQTVSLGYTFNKSLVQKIGVQSAKIFASSNNMFVYAPDWDLWDPQNTGPTPRILSVGLNVTF